MSKKRTPAVEGWFRDDAEPALTGTRCTACRCVFFPPERSFCRNPGCANDDFEEYALSRTGRLWSYTTNNYQPPAPFVPPSEPYEPFAIAAVELEEESGPPARLPLEGHDACIEEVLEPVEGPLPFFIEIVARGGCLRGVGIRRHGARC